MTHLALRFVQCFGRRLREAHGTSQQNQQHCCSNVAHLFTHAFLSRDLPMLRGKNADERDIVQSSCGHPQPALPRPRLSTADGPAKLCTSLAHLSLRMHTSHPELRHHHENYAEPDRERRL